MPENYATIKTGGSMSKKIYVKIKNVYGVEKVYPDSPEAEIFASIAGTKTLSENVIRAMVELGYEVALKPRFQFAELVKDKLIVQE